MNPLLFKSTYHRLLTRPLTLAVMAAYALYMASVGATLVLAESLHAGAAGAKAVNGLWMANGCIPLVWLLGAGLIGSDVSSGGLALLLSRPVSRASYVLSRWLGLYAAVISIHLGLLGIIGGLYLSQPNFHVSAATLANIVLGALYVTACHSALLTLLSTLLPGIGDSAGYAGAYVLAGFLAMALPADTRNVIGELVVRVLLPGTRTLGLAGQGQIMEAWMDATIYLVLAAVALGLAVKRLELRDLGYVNR